MGTSGSCPTCGKRWTGTPPGYYGYVVTDCVECQMNKSKAWKKIGDKMKDSSWGHKGGIGKDPKEKKLPKTWTKGRRNPDPKPYLKIMSRRGS